MYSVVHHHVVAILNSEIDENKKKVSILDVGCGNCFLMSLICRKLRELKPSLVVDIHGFDVSDSQVQESNFFEKSLDFLNKDIPEHEWENKLKMIETKDPWPYENDKFDFVVSNQVLEHVFDHNYFFGEMNRVLKSGGKGIHVFPLKHYFFEAHLYLPFVHRITNWDYLHSYIKLCSRVGLGRYNRHLEDNPNLTLDEFSKGHADFIVYSTNYITKKELYEVIKKSHLRASFRYTGWMYINKIRTILKMGVKYHYYYNKNIFINYIVNTILLRFSSITLFVEKQNIYR